MVHTLKVHCRNKDCRKPMVITVFDDGIISFEEYGTARLHVTAFGIPTVDIFCSVNCKLKAGERRD
jgi:hypothetical protein